MTEKRRILLNQLNEIVAELLECFQSLPDPEIMVYEVWSAKDVLAHLTFWHESFARNVADLAAGIQPTPLKGKLSDLNQSGVEALRPCSLQEIITRLQSAHRIIQTHILNPALTVIPYRKGSRDYTPEEHLEIVRDHIARHLRDVIQVCQRRSAE